MIAFPGGIDGGDALPGLRLVVLAGNGADGASALARRFGVSHKCLVPLAGRPLIGHVLQVAALHPRVTSLAVSIEREAFDPVYDELTRLPGRGTVQLVEARDNLADSVRDAARGWDGPLIVTTADSALLQAASIDAVADALGQADAVVSLARRAAVEAVHPGAKRRYHELADGAYANCNLYGLAGPGALAAADLFRHGPLTHGVMRLVAALGPVTLGMARSGLLGLPALIDRLAHRLHLGIRVVMLEDGTQAIDVDDDRTYAIAGECLARRLPPTPEGMLLPAPACRAVGSG